MYVYTRLLARTWPADCETGRPLGGAVELRGRSCSAQVEPLIPQGSPSSHPKAFCLVSHWMGPPRLLRFKVS